LCLDCTKTTRTLAAVVQGCQHFDHDVPIKGVVLNRVAGKRHETIVRKNIEHYCGLPVLGAIPKLKEENFPERHMGLVPTAEHVWAQKSVKAVGEIARKYLQLDLLERIAKQSPAVEAPFRADNRKDDLSKIQSGKSPKIGIVMDSAFQFYYPDNIDALKRQGAEIVYLSPLTEDTLPDDLDALYIGGGFPETHSEALANNRSFRKSLKTKAQEGFPIYAECGGLMYLGESLFLKGVSYPMSGIFPVVFKLYNRPQGHGYTHISVVKPNAFYPVGTKLKGHEFHYSKIVEWKGSDESMVFSMLRGTGIHNGKDGLCYKNVLATYTHVHSLGTPEWSDGVIKKAIAYRKELQIARK
jgi:cobyrinic acid a,c-diamide synthase